MVAEKITIPQISKCKNDKPWKNSASPKCISKINQSNMLKVATWSAIEVL